jgi:hypothetical protein
VKIDGSVLFTLTLLSDRAYDHRPGLHPVEIGFVRGIVARPNRLRSGNPGETKSASFGESWRGQIGFVRGILARPNRLRSGNPGAAKSASFGESWRDQIGFVRGILARPNRLRSGNCVTPEWGSGRLSFGLPKSRRGARPRPLVSSCPNVSLSCQNRRFANWRADQGKCPGFSGCLDFPTRAAARGPIECARSASPVHRAFRFQSSP